MTQCSIEMLLEESIVGTLEMQMLPEVLPVNSAMGINADMAVYR